MGTHGNLVLYEVSILCAKFDSKHTFEDHACAWFVSGVSQRIGILRLVKCIFTSGLLRCYYAFVLLILEYYFLVWGSVAECQIELLERQVHSVARLCPYQSFLPLCHRHHFAGLYTLTRLIRNSNHCLFSELPSASIPQFDRLLLRPQLIHWSLRYQCVNVRICKVFPVGLGSIVE